MAIRGVSARTVPWTDLGTQRRSVAILRYFVISSKKRIEGKKGTSCEHLTVFGPTSSVLQTLDQKGQRGTIGADDNNQDAGRTLFDNCQEFVNHFRRPLSGCNSDTCRSQFDLQEENIGPYCLLYRIVFNAHPSRPFRTLK